MGGIGSALKTIAGGEVTQITEIIHEGRKSALDRMEAWTGLHGAVGITGVTNELVVHSGNIEFLSIGSAVHKNGVNAPAGANATRLGQGWGARLGFDYYAKPVDQSTQALARGRNRDAQIGEAAGDNLSGGLSGERQALFFGEEFIEVEAGAGG